MIDLEPRKLPRQLRSRATVTAILDACASLLGRGGYEALTTNQISERAGVSIGTLYEYFPNKEAIVAALAARSFERMVVEMTAALQQSMRREELAGVEHLLSAGIRFMVDQRCVFKVLAREAPFVFQLPAVLRSRAALDSLAQDVRSSAGELLNLPVPETDAWLISRMLFGALVDIALLDQDEEQREVLMRELARLTFRMAMARDAVDGGQPKGSQAEAPPDGADNNVYYAF